MSQETNDVKAFRAAAKQARPGILREVLGFLRYYRKWWLSLSS